MTLTEARERLDAMANRWRRRQTLMLTLRLAAIALPLLAVVMVAVSGAIARLGATVLAIAMAALLARTLPHAPRASALLVARHLDRTQPTLEESATLLLDTDESLTGLERLQRTRLLPAFTAVDARQVFPGRAWRVPLGEVLAGLLVASTLLVVVMRYESPTVKRARSPFALTAETALDPLAALDVLIEPPAYTALPAFRQSGIDIEAPEGATITWRLPHDENLEIELATGSGDTLPFQLTSEALQLSWTATDPTVYRLIARSETREASRTPFARLDVVPDKPPVLAVVAPADRLTLIDADTTALDVEIRALDDFGLLDAHLVATLALGSGEMVEFREQRIPLASPDGAAEATFHHRFDLAALGVGSAAELYFHVEARDNRSPSANIGRSPTTIVRVQGDSATTADLGEGLPVILPPTYFRSQRQIIIDTEKLIAERDDLSDGELRRRSESLGGDQRALRMRYGTLLGEEFVSGRAVEAGETEVEGEHEEHTPETDEAQKVATVFDVLPEGLFHEHDSAEIATFFTSETRAQLKRVLAQMWEAEGHLRVVDPEGALPYEYQALELLKEVQEASRVYVQKVGFEAPPLEAERRLTGELDEIRTRTAEPSRHPAPAVETAARALLAALDEGATADSASLAGDAATVRPAITALAASSPDALGALEALDALAAAVALPAEARTSLQTALWTILPPPEPRPVPRLGASDSLSSLYRELRAEEDGS